MAADVNYEVEYNNRARVPENPAIMAGWSRDAEAYREVHANRLRVIPYGLGERQRHARELVADGVVARYA